MKYTLQNCVTEWSYTSGKAYRDPFNEVELDVVFTDPDGQEHTVPAFWGGEHEVPGGGTWRVRYASPKVGRHRCRTLCSDPTNTDLHGREDVLEVRPYTGEEPLYRHGPLQVSANRRHLEHRDGTPFFWLGDTWWMGLCRRLSWPGDFQTLTADRVDKGFTVIQIVAGLYPDMLPFDERGANEAGFPWDPNYVRINPAYFDMADLRIHWLVRSGLAPCIVGAWGNFIEYAGIEVMKRHWRYLIARYGAYPVVWCVAGEATWPKNPGILARYEGRLDDYVAKARAGWTEVARYLRATDPYRHLITIHPNDSARNTVDDPSVIDIDMLQTGHSDRRSVPNTVKLATEGYAGEPRMPVINGEVCYEGILEASRQEVQRMMFWACMLSGTAGHTYGANGIWQVNTREKPFGASPHGMSWGHTPWEDAYQLPGSRQLGLAKRLLERFEWWRFEPHPEWIAPHWTPEDLFLPYAAGIPGQVRIIYIPAEACWIARRGGLSVQGLEAGVNYRACYVNPADGAEHDLGSVMGGSDYVVPKPPVFQDWVLMLAA